MRLLAGKSPITQFAHTDRDTMRNFALLVAVANCVLPAPAVSAEDTPTNVQSAEYIALREGLSNSRLRFTADKEGRVAFLGGSITWAQNGWRDMTCEGLKKRFPQTRFDFVNAGISSTDSTLGPFRLGDDVFGRGQVDLLFVEFAVNDHHNSRADLERIRGMEGIIRQARTRNPQIDIVMMYFVEPDKMDEIKRGRVPAEIVSHEKVAAHYRITSIDLARQVTHDIEAGRYSWDDFGGLHPDEFGHRIYAETIERLFDTAWKEPASEGTERKSRPLPEPIDALNYQRARYVDLDRAVVVEGWKYVDSWSAKDAGTRPRFRDVPMLVATEPGAILKLYFEGTAVGALVVAGPDAGVLEYRVNGGPYRAVDQFTQWSKRLHIPWAYVLEADLAKGEHELTLRTTSKKNADSRGYASRIVKFLVN